MTGRYNLETGAPDGYLRLSFARVNESVAAEGLRRLREC